MLIGIDVNEVLEYIPEQEKGAEKPTTFLIGVITNKEKQRLFKDAFNANGDMDFGKLFEKIPDIVKAGLKGIKNIAVNGEAKDVTVVDDALLNLLPYNVLVEVYKKIMEFNKISEAEEKN